MKIAIGNDHVGYSLKKQIVEYLSGKGHEMIDFGADNEARVDYPVYAEKVALAVTNNEYERGILICGTGGGISIAANKVHGIRCIVCSEPYTARLSRLHNDANILALGARVIGDETAKMIVDEFLAAEYEGGRHQIRVDMIKELENKTS